MGDERPGARRDLALDILKGVLVLVMVVHHSFDYFWQGNLLYRLVRFVTGAFIFTAGFTVSAILWQRYREQVGALAGKLLLRGLRLIGLFALLNLAILATVKRHFLHDLVSQGAIGSRLADLFLAGNARFADFHLLLLIGYLFAALAPLALLSRRHRPAAAIACLAVFAAALAFHNPIETGYNLRYLSLGLLGFVLGWAGPAAMAAIPGRLGWLVAAYLALLAAHSFLKTDFLLYSTGVVVTLAALYAVCARLLARTPAAAPLSLLGRHSLLGYLVQIALLQAGLPLLSLVPGPSSRAAAAIVAVSLSTWAATAAVERWTVRSPRARTLYRAVFG